MDEARMGKIGRGIALTAVVAASCALMLGGYNVIHVTGQGVEAASYSVTATPTPAPEQDTTTAQEFHEHEVTQMRTDDLAAQAAAKAAADKASADAQAAAQATAPKRAASYAPGQAPKGTPIPQHLVTDPNAGDYNQMRLEDPGFFCAAKSGSTINGVPVCD